MSGRPAVVMTRPPASFRHLDGGGAYAACAAVDENRLTGLESGFHEDVYVGGQIDLGQGGCFFKGPAGWNRHQELLVHGYLFGVPTTAKKRADFVPNLPTLHVRAHFDDLTGHVQTHNIWRPWRRRVVSCCLRQVGSIERRSMDGHERLLRLQDRVVYFSPDELGA